MVNIGQLIKEELEKQGRSAGWLAKELATALLYTEH